MIKRKQKKKQLKLIYLIQAANKTNIYNFMFPLSRIPAKSQITTIKNISMKYELLQSCNHFLAQKVLLGN